MVNPLVQSSQLVLLKMLSGDIFGHNYFIDLKLLVYSNEISTAESLKLELERCAFSNMNVIEITSDLPRIRDADIFCFISDLANPNKFYIEHIENEAHFDTLYLLIKVANHLSWQEDDELEDLKNAIKTKPIFLTDGLLALDILASLSKNMPSDVFFATTPLEAIAKSTLGDYLNVQCKDINDVLVWAANDEIFHLEVKKPLIINEKIDKRAHCENDTISNELLQSLKIDYTKFNSTWMRKDFLEKVASSAARNPYGCIYKAAEFSKTLKQIWKARSGGSGTKVYSNMGVISDGSIGTMKGYPYVLPLVFSGNRWEVNKSFEESTYLKQEIKRINKTVKEQREKFISYCKKFLLDNVINLAFISTDNESSIGDSCSSRSVLREQRK
ncbi:unnamed protein product [Parnassius apollo]|uniref:(apollo) hypothetical protein n=1 Tax=Parnassius apollo TaxID=110799 RepID=A0A8S3WNC1_PARAO|nr:unnamed protein product [Parnassius apollo]